MTLRKEVCRTENPVCMMGPCHHRRQVSDQLGVLTNLDESEEINACTVKIKCDVDGEEQDWLYLFKNETHNHPTEIEPFGGAATCIGGAIRDPLSGRSYVYQAMRVTGAGDSAGLRSARRWRASCPSASWSPPLPQVIPLRQPDRSGHRSGGRDVPSRLCGQALEIGAVVGATPLPTCGVSAPPPAM